MDVSIKEKIDQWLNGNYDQETKKAIQSLLDNNETTELWYWWFERLNGQWF